MTDEQSLNLPPSRARAGPFKINGVPLRRVSQAYVIATSTKVDFAGVKVNEKITDEFFSVHKTKKAAENEATFFNKKQGKKVRIIINRSAFFCLFFNDDSCVRSTGAEDLG